MALLRGGCFKIVRAEPGVAAGSVRHREAVRSLRVKKPACRPVESPAKVLETLSIQFVLDVRHFAMKLADRLKDLRSPGESKILLAQRADRISGESCEELVETPLVRRCCGIGAPSPE
jgi:hypothetical protein